jgi:succinyl-diaminopimelate desuccinylase
VPARSKFDVVDFVSRLVAIPSCDPPGGELDVARHVHRQLQALGIESQLDEFRPGRANVMARVRGTGQKPALVYSAHLDTTPTGDQQWSFDPFAGDVVDGEIRGRGASDMKSAVAAFIAAAVQLGETPEPLAGDVILAFTAGESANCIGARRLVEQGFQEEIGAFLCGEPSTLDIIVAEKAILWLKACATGTIGHVSGAAGTNAIDLMVTFLTALGTLQLDLEAHPLLTGPSLSVGRISGGSAVNVTPDHCEAEIDVRFGPGVTVDSVLDQIRPLLPDRMTLEVADFKPAVVEPPDSPFVATCSNALTSVSGRAPAIRGVSYYSDAAILLDGINVPFAIVGPGHLGQSGQRDETASVRLIRDSVDVYVAITRQWLG